MKNYEKSIYLEEEMIATISFEIFNKVFSYQTIVNKKDLKITENELLDYFQNKIKEFRYESRLDEKRIILAYGSGVHYSTIGFMFAVEENDQLKEMMTQYPKQNQEIMNYIFNNKKNLNFNI